ncbi:hypothetical protein HCH_00691 [Hahella chejuensis KCTC 2396]|uniref:Uncharacterized protein n=1 Tax=Hahella chejuensis (strain KCTC 2396) TaxID=349521 RepID=Q2SP34_HAHCH|nr:hypothetical protein HCH_00691 [Hahella chejuensis KCTC 2396]
MNKWRQARNAVLLYLAGVVVLTLAAGAVRMAMQTLFT